MHTVYPYSKRTRKKSNGKKLFCQATDFSFNKKSFKIYNNTLWTRLHDLSFVGGEIELAEKRLAKTDRGKEATLQGKSVKQYTIKESLFS